MGHSWYIYILWIVLLIAGLWLIISYGSTLHAREDLAGEWELTPEKPSAGVDVKRMKVEQSGKYFNIVLPQGRAIQMKLTEEAVVDQRFGEHKRIVLQSSNTTARFEGRSGGDLWRFYLDGAEQGAYLARLTDRLYPKPARAKSASTAPAHAR
jgi:hypothetical protein